MAAPGLAAAPRRALVFIGFMGSGKSSAAREVARALGVHALDSDALLEQRMGHSIAAEVAERGEGSFREREEEVVLELLGRAGAGAVIALGGGSVLSSRVRDALAPHLAVLLDVDADSAWERVGGQGGTRPLAVDEQAFRALHAEREPLYEALADAILPSSSPASLALRALPALQALARAPVRARMVWASAASGEYPVVVGRGLLGELEGEAPALRLWPLERARSRPFGVSDETVARLYGPRLGHLDALIELPPGEQHKTLASAERVWRELARAGMRRADHVVALGGGVVGDLAGFCAATYQRGVPVVHVPTTLVAQVDSAYGGKTGVDLPEAKNYVGAYHQPAGVLADPDVLATLPARELAAGWVEALKTALIAGGSLWESLREGAPVGEREILACARVKLAIVARDERDAGGRQVLNLGHTIGHAIEAATGYRRYRHGEAVGLGLLAALSLSGQAELRAHVRELLLARDLPVGTEGVSAEEVLAAAAYDKKREGAAGRQNGLPPFVLVRAPGEVEHGCRLGEAEVRAAVEELVGR
jgi:shikimate kinase/3-dehydroquinate synthase